MGAAHIGGASGHRAAGGARFARGLQLGVLHLAGDRRIESPEHQKGNLQELPQISVLFGFHVSLSGEYVLNDGLIIIAVEKYVLIGGLIMIDVVQNCLDKG